MKFNLVLGGFPRHTRKPDILAKVNQLLAKIDVTSDLDEDAFVTGPRRSSALLPFRVRANEGFSDAKSRMHRVLGAIVRAREPIHGMDRPLWAGVAKTPAEREISGHCTWVRGVCRNLDPTALERLEHTTMEPLGVERLSCLAARRLSLTLIPTSCTSASAGLGLHFGLTCLPWGKSSG